MTRRGFFAPVLGLAAATRWPGTAPRGRELRVTRGLAYGDGRRMDLYAPPAGTPVPTLVLLHEAGRLGDRMARALAARGFLVALPEGSAAFPGFIADAAQATAAVAGLADAHGGDPDRLGVLGCGPGAAPAMMIALDRRYMAAVDRPGLIRAAAGLGAGETAGDAAALVQPAAFARGDAPPIWLAPAADGPSCALASLAGQVRAAGGRSEAHAGPACIADPAAALANAAAFFHRELG